ncbi:SymE family type I addiction module toxin [Limnobaculum parvum]|uniref:Type I toxin-antitoxin system SymE family toxin n=1 Tax=Limnobaculum parvum TaxID=2172103 RepID=A0A2Y9TW48_9GAMM|nr:SymE family type I addiction module toxin [Limnobaculum parvum]AWH87801.1 type I toxin-antitoxin system SymE family toxin [Limnobaculum parvum]AWH87808.1 type I toxin-antitoxin system SymE family toxin [Limnobaculum parvum]
MAKRNHKAIHRISQAERYIRVNRNGVSLQGRWLAEAGFTHGMPLKVRVMPDCIVLTVQNTRELWSCLEGLSIQPFDANAALNWLNGYPGGLMVTEVAQ